MHRQLVKTPPRHPRITRRQVTFLEPRAVGSRFPGTKSRWELEGEIPLEPHRKSTSCTRLESDTVSTRIAKQFFGVIHYGTAVKNSGDTQYVYDVSYDDGDFETFTETEFQKAVSLFESQPESIQKQSSIETDEIGIEVLQGRNKILQVLKHKTITQNGVSYACFKVKLKNKSVQKTQWVQAGSILALSGKDYISHNWG
jgi:hypothetical protein